MQLRLPVVVIGGGLTAIDTATEALAYYPVQVEKFLARYEALVAERGEAAVRGSLERGGARRSPRSSSSMPAPSRAERAAAEAEGRPPRIRELLDSWGGVDHRLPQAPDRFAELHPQPRGGRQGARRRHPLRRVPLAAKAVEVDRFGHAQAIRLNRLQHVRDGAAGSPWTRSRPAAGAQPVLVAAGTQPNTVLAREHPDDVPQLDGRYFQAFDDGRRRPSRPSAGQAEEVFMCSPSAAPTGAWRQLLGRRAPLLRRQRGQGHGERQAGLSRWSHRTAGPHAAGQRHRPTKPLRRGSNQALAGDGLRGQPPDARPSSRWWCARPRRPGLPARPVLPPAELRDRRPRAATAPPWPWRAWP